MVFIFVIFNLLFVQINNIQSFFTPQYSGDNKYPFVLPFSNNRNIYVMTSKMFLKISQKDGNIKIDSSSTQSLDYSKEAIFLVDKSKTAYLFYSHKFYIIKDNQNNGIMKNISISEFSQNVDSENYFGSIIFDNSFAIYGINSNNLNFLKKQEQNDNFDSYSYNFEHIEKASCKFIENEKFICALIINKYIEIYFFNSLSKSDAPNYYKLNYNNSNFNDYSNLALYDTTKSATIKLLCMQKNDKSIICLFLNILIETPFVQIEIIGKNFLNFTLNDEYSEKDCYFSEISNEYLFCCDIYNFIFRTRCNKSISHI